MDNEPDKNNPGDDNASAQRAKDKGATPATTPNPDLSAFSPETAQTLMPPDNSTTGYVSQNTTEGLPVVSNSPKKNTKIIASIAGAVVLVIALIIGFFVYAQSTIRSANKDIEPLKSAAKVDVSTAKATITSILPIITSGQRAIDKTDGAGGYDKESFALYDAADYTVDGFNFATYPEKSSGLAVRDIEAKVKADADSVASFFGDNNFRVIPSESDKTSDTFSEGTKNTTYASKTVVCHTQSAKDTTNKGQSTLGIGCADISSYKTMAKVIQPFYNAFVASEDARQQGIKFLRFGAPTIHDGVEGYQNAEIPISNTNSIGGYAGVFYKEPNKDWTYAFGAQSVQSCSFFVTDILKKSFSGRPCMDTSGDIVTVKYTTPAITDNQSTDKTTPQTSPSPSPSVSPSPTPDNNADPS